MPADIIVYGSRTCPQVPPVRALLDRAGAVYKYIDIGRDREARERVKVINHGYASIPTIVFPDGETLTEPKMHELEAKLRVMGIETPPFTMRSHLKIIGSHPSLMLVGGIFLALGVLGGESGLITAGAVIAGLIVLGRVFGE